MKREAIGFWLAAVLLGPMIVWQGRQVRQQTLRLPEPTGDRSGHVSMGGGCSGLDLAASEAPPLRLLILGDSAAAGVGSSDQERALCGQLVARLAGHCNVQFRLQARTGFTIEDVLLCLEEMATEPCEQTLREQTLFDVVLVSVGVNDVTALTSIPQWQHRLGKLDDLLKQGFGASQVMYTAVPPMHHFPALPNPLRWWLGWRARQLNQALEQQLGASSILRVDIPFDEAYMAEDGFHPGPAGYAIWAERAECAIRAHLGL